MALIKTFKADTYFKAFILNAMVSAIVVVFATEFKYFWERTINLSPWESYTDNQRIGIVMIATFLATLLVYQIMYFLLGFGGGLITTNKSVRYF